MRVLVSALLLGFFVATGYARAREPISGTFYYAARDGRWTLRFFPQGSYEIVDPRGKSFSGAYNSTDREVGLYDTDSLAGQRRHFRYTNFRGEFTLESTRYDGSTNAVVLNRMPPPVGGAATFRDRFSGNAPGPIVPPIISPPVINPPPWNPGWNPGWNVTSRINEQLDRADRSQSSARDALRRGDRSEFLLQIQRAQEALQTAASLAR